MLTIPHILDLYRRYLSDLKAVRRQQFWFHRRHDNPLVRRLRKWRVRRYMLFPALDDLEAEITYLLIRDQRPKVVMEVSPNAGWSSTWILSALRDNADGASFGRTVFTIPATGSGRGRRPRGDGESVRGQAGEQ